MNGKTLTAEQCSKLSLYILMTTKTREGEAEAWEKLAEEKKEDGSPKYIHAADNAQFWRELDADLRKILRDVERGQGQERGRFRRALAGVRAEFPYPRRGMGANVRPCKNRRYQRVERLRRSHK